MNIHTSQTEFLKTEVQRLRALVRAQQITINKLEALAEQPAQQEPVAWVSVKDALPKAVRGVSYKASLTDVVLVRHLDRPDYPITAHTPGPWSINDWPQATTDIAIGAVGTPLIAKVPLRDVSINEQKANAALIAAAPELLAQLKTMVAAFLTYAPKTDGAEFNCVLESTALIAKIEGGAA